LTGFDWAGTALTRVRKNPDAAEKANRPNFEPGSPALTVKEQCPTHDYYYTVNWGMQAKILKSCSQCELERVWHKTAQDGHLFDTKQTKATKGVLPTETDTSKFAGQSALTGLDWARFGLTLLRAVTECPQMVPRAEKSAQ
jgi:hypothetical protein